MYILFVNLSNLIIAVVIARGFAAARAGRLQTFNGLQYREAFRRANNVWRRRWSSLRIRRQLVTGLLLQLFTNSFDFTVWAMVWVTGYPFLISGKPALSIPAFVPVMFELTILFSALSCVGLMLLMNHLPRLHNPLFTCERFRRASDDRFFISIEARDPRFYRSKTEAFLKSLGASAVEAVVED